MRFGQVFGDCDRDCNSGYDGDCDDDFGSGFLFIFHRFDNFWASRPPGRDPVGSENFDEPFLKAKNPKKVVKK